MVVCTNLLFSENKNEIQVSLFLQCTKVPENGRVLLVSRGALSEDFLPARLHFFGKAKANAKAGIAQVFHAGPEL